MPLFSVHALVDLRLSQYHGIAEEVKLLPLVPCIIHYLNGRLLQGCVLMYIFCLYFTFTHTHTHTYKHTPTYNLSHSLFYLQVSILFHCNRMTLSDYTFPEPPL